MSLRLSLAVLALAAFAPAALPSPPSSAPSTLRIEAFGPRRLQVELTSTPAGLFGDSAQTGDAQHKLFLVTPAAVVVADSVRRIHVVVQGMGAVRLLFDFDSPSTHPQPTAPIWGRDVTLVRQPNGRFESVVRAHPLPE